MPIVEETKRTPKPLEAASADERCIRAALSRVNTHFEKKLRRKRRSGRLEVGAPRGIDRLVRLNVDTRPLEIKGFHLTEHGAAVRFRAACAAGAERVLSRAAPKSGERRR